MLPFNVSIFILNFHLEAWEFSLEKYEEDDNHFSWNRGENLGSNFDKNPGFYRLVNSGEPLKKLSFKFFF